MTTLTDRYVWAVVRTAPEKQRRELDREVRALVTDATDAHANAGDPEREALLELGDPERLAATYLDRPLALIGPRTYLVYIRLLKVLYTIVLPIVFVANLAVQVFVAPSFGGALGAAIAVSVNAAVHLGFWPTLLFAVIDRLPASRQPDFGSWSPDRLPDLPSRPREEVGELIGTVVFAVLAIGALIWQQQGTLFRTDDGSGIPFLNPSLWGFILTWSIVLAVAWSAFALVVYRRGWTTTMASINVILNLAFAVPAIVLLTQRTELVNPAFADAAGWQLDAATQPWVVPTLVISSVVIVVVCGWNCVDGFLRARRAARATSAPS
ncbi:hypothetical protein E6C70_00115 [Glaciibacter flavus]|uniref:Uncharacterized protein n=1 Tax=Orlajensenia flava TaxID=2565934 RepID=A0A4S4G2I7_9MICO|nr:hypothetical protein [Glaciibacter flavus]THG36376.1 hypothetical protein E6C70_00115 [Glaciibacter flavus]